MPARTALTCRAPLTFLAATTVSVLSACSGIQIKEPVADAVVILSLPTDPTRVVVTSTRSFTGLAVTVDGNDVSNQFSGAGDSEAALALQSGTHTVVASADAFCSYCTGQQWRTSDTKTFCVTVAIANAPTTKTIFAKTDNLSWSSSVRSALTVASDSGTDSTRWTMMTPATGMGSVRGTIRSKQFPCSCLRSPDGTNGSRVELADCADNDPRQEWNGTRRLLSGTTGFYRFENRAVALSGADWGCLTEGLGGQVTQSNCTDADDRIWSVRHNGLGMFESNPTPWEL